MKKTLVIDARVIGKVGHGISKYLEGIIDNLGKNEPFTQLILRTLQLDSLKDVEIICIIKKDCPIQSPARQIRFIEVNTSSYHPLSWIKIPMILKRLNADIYFNPTFASYPYLGVTYIQTVHDLNHLYFGNFLQKLYYKLLLKKSLRSATKILTVSKFVESEIENWVKIPSDHIQVIYNTIDTPVRLSAFECQKELKTLGLEPNEFFLCISNSKPHKNLDFLAKCYQAYRNQTSSLPLPLAMSVSPEEIPQDYREGIIPISRLSDKTLTALYQANAGFFFPSLYEGFGRPPLEAALAGARVFASDIPPHREGSEHFGLKIEFLPPQDEKSWSEAFASATMINTK